MIFSKIKIGEMETINKFTKEKIIIVFNEHDGLEGEIFIIIENFNRIQKVLIIMLEIMNTEIIKFCVKRESIERIKGR